MVKRAFRDHRFAVSFIAINTLIVVEEFAHQHLYPPPHHWMGLGWYWTAILSFPCSILLHQVHWPWESELLSILTLVLIGAIQWGVIGAAFDHFSRGRRHPTNT